MSDVDRKAVLRLFTYGLYAITLRRGDEHHGFTANWLFQVSFDPPLVALSVENDSHSIELLRESGAFTVNVLPTGAREIAGTLGRHWKNVPDKLARVPHEIGPSGRAVIEGALGYLDCEVRDRLPAGDSTLHIAEVVGAKLLREGRPLTLEETGFKHAG